MAGLTLDQLSSSLDSRLDNNSENLLLWSASFEAKLQSLGLTPVSAGMNAFTASITSSFTALSSSVNTNSASFSTRINSVQNTSTNAINSINATLDTAVNNISQIQYYTSSLTQSITSLSASVKAKTDTLTAITNYLENTIVAVDDNLTSYVATSNSKINNLNAFSASITASYVNFSGSQYKADSGSFSMRINTLVASTIPEGTISSSAQLPTGIVSSSAQLPTGIVSGSIQVLGGTGIISSSTQLNNATITNLTITNLTTINETASVLFSSGSNKFGDFSDDIHSFTGSVKISGSITTIGSSTATSFTGAIAATNGVVSGSSQIVYASISSIPAGIVSGSSQLTSILPAGVVSGSSQIDVMSTTNIARLATTGSNTFIGNQIITGSLILSSSAATDFTVIGNQIISGNLYLPTLTPIFNIGDAYEGGEIAYIYQVGDTEYEAGKVKGIIINNTEFTDNGSGQNWGNINNTAATSQTDGLSNTQQIASNAIDSTLNIAALVYNTPTTGLVKKTIDGYNDWFIPSSLEWSNFIYPTYVVGGHGTFSTRYYWTSTEYFGDYNLAMAIQVSGVDAGNLTGLNKLTNFAAGFAMGARLVRTFTVTATEYMLKWNDTTNVIELDDDISTFAKLTTNQFNGNQTISGSLIVSSSAAVDVTVVGNQTITGSLIVSSSAAVDVTVIGTQTITGSLIVTGSIALVPQGAPSSPASGSLYFSSGDSHFYGWNGLVWKQLDNA